jgi:hypothetical protein
VAVTGARVSTMAKYCFWITTSPESAACLYRQNTCEGHAGCLASLASYHCATPTTQYTKRGQHHCGARAHRSCVSNRPQDRPEFGFGNTFGSNATAIPRADISAALVVMMKRCQSFPIRSWVDPPHVWNLTLRNIPFPGLPKLLLSATHLVTLSFILFLIPDTFTRRNGHCPLHVDQPRITFAWIPIPSILP